MDTSYLLLGAGLGYMLVMGSYASYLWWSERKIYRDGWKRAEQQRLEEIQNGRHSPQSPE